VLSVAGLLIVTGLFPVGRGLFPGVKERDFPAVYLRVERVIHILDIPVVHHPYVLSSQECPNSDGHRGYTRGIHRQQWNGCWAVLIVSPPTVKRVCTVLLFLVHPCFL